MTAFYKGEITCATQGTSIYYTTDGSTPTASGALYAGLITVDKTMSLKAIAMKDGMKDSAADQADYTIRLHEYGEWVFDSESHWKIRGACGELGEKTPIFPAAGSSSKNLPPPRRAANTKNVLFAIM